MTCLRWSRCHNVTARHRAGQYDPKHVFNQVHVSHVPWPCAPSEATLHVAVLAFIPIPPPLSSLHLYVLARCPC